VTSAILTDGLGKKFRRVNALNDLNLNVPEGALFAMVGPNGAGKTTLIKLLMNIVDPTAGHAEVLGIDSRRIRGAFFAAIGYVSENQEIPAWMRVGEFLAYLRPFYPTWDRSLEWELSRQFELPLDRKLSDLSRGVRMKAVLAGSLAYRPKLIVLDEPFTGLDPLVRDQFIEGLLKRAGETTIFVSSHDLGEIESFASHIGYLEEGHLRFSEELRALSGRFRQVELAFDAPPSVPAKIPGTWMQLSVSETFVRLVESRFDVERTNHEIRELFGAAPRVSYTPMSLRSIFLAIAKSSDEG
jgi:ABC-2 type transport system ATP-binding protein